MTPIISVEHLSKTYKISHQNNRPDSFREVVGSYLKFNRLKKKAPEFETFYALNDVSFEIQEGEVLGIIGSNGAGKSTLLKILSRITEPTSGRVCLNGRVASLLEVGTGFHPELTGRENIFLNGSILGMEHSEIRKKFDEIVDFSGVERFLDTPVKRYSSGMYVRLAFSVAAHLEPEILLVDEVLAVGDIRFQKKCLQKMKDVSQTGRTVLFVSHNLTAIRTLCTSCLWVGQGQIQFNGKTSECIEKYIASNSKSSSNSYWENPESAFKEDRVRVARVKASRDEDGIVKNDFFTMNSPITIQIKVETKQSLHFRATLHFLIKSGEIAFTSYGQPEREQDEKSPAGSYEFTCTVPADLLNEEIYSIRLIIFEDWIHELVVLEDVISLDVRDTTTRELGAWQGREPGPLHPKLNWEVKSQ
ncbi:MAG: ABC transporter ATP-binding protein [Verrucomicrobiota bacterium]